MCERLTPGRFGAMTTKIVLSLLEKVTVPARVLLAPSLIKTMVLFTDSSKMPRPAAGHRDKASILEVRLLIGTHNLPPARRLRVS